jgi:glutaredoxin
MFKLQRCLRTAFILALAFAAAAPAQMYFWEDENGVKHFSDSPPPAGAKVTSLEEYRWAPSADVGPGDPSAPESAPVVIYTTSWCGYCKKAKEWMSANQVAYREFDIETSASGRAAYESAGGTGGVPLIVVGETTMQGWNEGSMRQALNQAGVETSKKSAKAAAKKAKRAAKNAKAR